MEWLQWFEDRRRKKVRERKGYSFLSDFFIRSEISDYRHLRIVFNFLSGLILCAALYYLAWKELNFADFNPIYTLVFKWTLIMIITCTYTGRAVFRCSLILLMLGAFGKNGQLPLTMLVFNSLQTGPMTNIMDNYRLSVDNVVCGVDIQTKIAANRLQLTVGPLQDLFEKFLSQGSGIGKNIAGTVKKIMGGFMSEVDGEETEEDKEMRLADQAARGYADRGVKMSEDSSTIQTQTIEKPFWTSFKTKIGRHVGERLFKRCTDVFDHGISFCHKTFSTMKTSCEKIVPFKVFAGLCRHLDAVSVCEDATRKLTGHSMCKTMNGNETNTKNVEGDIQNMNNVSSEITDELKMSIHVVAVQQPRDVQTLHLEILKKKAQMAIITFKAMFAIVKQLFNALLVFFVYTLFRDGVVMIEKYQTDIDFNNRFISRNFWDIDRSRIGTGMPVLRILTKEERNQFGLITITSLPLRSEWKAMRNPFFKWFTLFLVVILFCFIDQKFHTMVQIIVETIPRDLIGTAIQPLKIKINGKGPISDLVRSFLYINTTKEVDKNVEHESCLMHPYPPNSDYNIKYLFVPLFGMLIMQVFFSFIIKRIVVFYVIPFMFPRRDRARLIFLYNKILFFRAQSRSEARARIRFVVSRWKLNKHRNEGGWFTENSWMKRKVFDLVFRTKECLLCKSKLYRRRTYHCEKCPATFCKICLLEMEAECYACQAEAGLVNSQYTVLNKVTTEDTAEGREQKKSEGGKKTEEKKSEEERKKEKKVETTVDKNANNIAPRSGGK